MLRHCLPERLAKKVPLIADAEYPAPCTNVDVVVRSTPVLFSTTNEQEPNIRDMKRFLGVHTCCKRATLANKFISIPNIHSTPPCLPLSGPFLLVCYLSATCLVVYNCQIIL